MRSIYRSEGARRAVEERYRAFLQRWPVPCTESVIPTCQGDTFVVACGPRDASPVVLLHGAGFNSAAWLDDVAAWAQSHRVYAVDVIGEPGLSAPSRPSLDSDDHARWLDDVLDQLGVARSAFVGTSLGGWIALDDARRRPQRVARLALLVPGGIGRQKYGAILASLLLMPFGRVGKRAALRFALGPFAATSAPGTPATAWRDFADFMLLIHESYKPRRDRLPSLTDDQLRRLDVPLQFIAGAQDRLLDSRHAARRLRHLLPGAAVTLLPDTGHVPTGHAAIVQQFLTDGGRQ